MDSHPATRRLIVRFRNHLEGINESDFAALIEHEVREGRTIEYKRELPGLLIETA